MQLKEKDCTRTGDHKLKVANSYVERGFSVIPIKTDGSKKPAIPWKVYQQRTPTAEELKKWFGNGKNFDIGIVTGRVSNIAVVDIDSEEGENYAIAHNFLDTPSVKTARGKHLYYKYKEGVGNFAGTNSPFRGIDFRGEGGYVVAPPSIHSSGVAYKWISEDLPMANIPQEILQYALKK